MDDADSYYDEEGEEEGFESPPPPQQHGNLSPTADAILDVTPVTTTEDDDDDDEDDADDDEDADDEDEDDNHHHHVRSRNNNTVSSPPRRNNANEDAFSSSSDDSDEEEDDDDDDDDIVVESVLQRLDQTEWDKAMRSGKPSKGQYASDLVAAAAPSRSYDSAEIADQSSDYSGFLDEEDGGSSSSTMLPSIHTSRSNSAATTTSTTTPRSHPPLPPSSKSSSSMGTTTTPTTTSAASHVSARSAARIDPSPSSLSRTSNGGASVEGGGAIPPTTPTTAGGVVTPVGAHPPRPLPTTAPDHHLSAGVLPDVLMTMRQKIEALTLFDSDMMKLAADQIADPILDVESREALKRSSQQSISAAVLVSLAHKRYERRRLAAMEIEKVVRSLVLQEEMERVRAILLLLSDDYVRSTDEDARKGGVVALAACAIGLKKAPDSLLVQECRDLILASVVHACQDHSQRVRYYATESLFNVVKVIPTMAVQHFFILFEILRSLYADVDADVRSGAELLDKKLKEVIVNAMNAGTFTAEVCVPVFARFVYMRNKATKRLTLTWLQELNEKLIASPILEFLHLFLDGIFDMVADPTPAIRESAILFLNSVLPRLLSVNSEAFERSDNKSMHVDFDRILQSLVSTLEHPDPFVRKVAMYWMSRIVKTHMRRPETTKPIEIINPDGSKSSINIQEEKSETDVETRAAVATSVRNSLPHILPGILLSIGDDHLATGASKDSFIPDQSTRALAEQTNTTLQEAVRRDGQAYVQLLDGFIVALREELDASGGLIGRFPPAVERAPYRMDVKQDGTGIESSGWFNAGSEAKRRPGGDASVMSRLCALQWVIVLYESVVPVRLKADYAKEFVLAIIRQLVDSPPQEIVYKSLEVLAIITVPVDGESYGRHVGATASRGTPSALGSNALDPTADDTVTFALGTLEPARRDLLSRDREVFSSLIKLYSFNEALLADLSKVITYMCKLQPAEFVFVSFAVELDLFIAKRLSMDAPQEQVSSALKFVSSFIQNMGHVLLNKSETRSLRNELKDCVRVPSKLERGRQRSTLFHILLHSFAHNLAVTISLCFWGGAYRTVNMFLIQINPLDINLMFLLEVDRFIEMLERPLFRHLHVRMLESDRNPVGEGSGTMLFKALKALLMLLPQSTCYFVLRDRLISISRFRQSAIRPSIKTRGTADGDNDVFLSRVLKVRTLHCGAAWLSIREGSLELPTAPETKVDEEGASRTEWLGYESQEEYHDAQEKYREKKAQLQLLDRPRVEEISASYDNLVGIPQQDSSCRKAAGASVAEPSSGDKASGQWKRYWTDGNH